MAVKTAPRCSGADAMAAALRDFTGAPVSPNSTLGRLCGAAVERRLTRTSILPELYLDPLSPLPLADKALPRPAVSFIYFTLASRPYAHQTIRRNVRALQRPGALDERGSNQTNLFLVHLDAKMKEGAAEAVRSAVRDRPDVYFLHRRRHVMWAGWSMMLVVLDVTSSILQRKLGFEYLITLGDADLTMRVDGEIRGFFDRFPGRSIMSIVQKKQDPRRYAVHASYRTHCWVSLSSVPGFAAHCSGEGRVSLRLDRTYADRHCL